VSPSYALTAGRGAKPCFVARFATVYLQLFPEGKPTSTTVPGIVEALVEQLEKDVRVTEVALPTNKAMTFAGFFPMENDPAVLPLDTSGKWLSPVFDEPIRFAVSVPAKNQPQVEGGELPPERYIARWDGSALMILWEQDISAYVPWLGGRIVLDIVVDAATAAGYRAKVQEPAIAHVEMRITSGSPDARKSAVDFSRNPKLLELTVAGQWDSQRIADHMFAASVRLVGLFYQLENVVERIAVTEESLQRDLAGLLSVQHRRARLRLLHPLRYVRGRWNLRGWRRDAEETIARVSLTLARIQALHSLWLILLREYESAARDAGEVSLFTNGLEQIRQYITSLDLSLTEQVIQRAERRLDYSSLARATLVSSITGAIAGGVMGALAGHFIR
jgi:hypothetical protein